MSTGEYWVIKLTPDPVRAEPLNIGLVMSSKKSGLRIDFPEEALERAAKWCSSLNQAGLLALSDRMATTIRAEYVPGKGFRQAGQIYLISEMFGNISVSEPRWIDLPQSTQEEEHKLFNLLLDRLVLPPRPIAFGGGMSASKKLAAEIFPDVKRYWPKAVKDERLLGRSGVQYVADIFVGGNRPRILSTMSVSSSWQGLRTIEAKAFELFDIGRTFESSSLFVCCEFPDIDPEGIRDKSEKIFGSIDTTLVTRESVLDVAAYA